MIFSPDGKTLASLSDSGEVKLWNANSEPPEWAAGRPKWADALERMERNPDKIDPADIEALKEIAKGKPDAKAGNAPAEKARTWRFGKETVEATLESEDGQIVTLKKPDGKTIQVIISYLSQEDRDYIKAHGATNPPRP